VFGKVRSAVDALKAAARALDPACIDGHDAAFRAGRLSPTQAAEITSAAGADPAPETELLDAAGAT
jgi:hypothetical protein